MVPDDVEYGVFVPFTQAKALNGRMKHVPDIDQLVETCCGQIVTTWAEFGAVDLSLVPRKLQVLGHESLALLILRPRAIALLQ